jgi:hypothetical protein
MGLGAKYKALSLSNGGKQTQLTTRIHKHNTEQIGKALPEHE